MKKNAANIEVKRVVDYIYTQDRWVNELLCELINFQSISGHEGSITEFLFKLLSGFNGDLLCNYLSSNIKELGRDKDFTETEKEVPYTERPNLILHKKSNDNGRSLIVCGHSDVVPGEKKLFKAKLDNGTIYGRGACDDKGPIVAWLLALKALDVFGIQLKGNLETHLVIEEEIGGNGALDLILNGRKADAVVVLEPSQLNIHPAGRGAIWFRLEIEGRSTHMASIEKGISALKQAVEVIGRLEEYEKLLLKESEKNELFSMYINPVMVNFGILKSGNWPSTVPENAILEGGVGFLPDRTIDTIKKEINNAIKKNADDWFLKNHTLKFDKLRNEAYAIDTRHPIVQSFKKACGFAKVKSEVIGMPASCDARLYYHRGKMPTVVFGPGKLSDAHSNNEQISTNEILKASEILLYLTKTWCGWK